MKKKFVFMMLALVVALMTIPASSWAIGSLAASGITSSSVTLSWARTSLSETSFVVYKNSALVGNTTSTSYTVTGLMACSSYAFTVNPVINGSESSANGQTIYVNSAGACDTIAPSAPTSFSVYGSTDAYIVTQWSGATDNVGIWYYKLYKNGTYLTDTTNTSYTFNGLQPATSYTLGVQTVDTHGNVSPIKTITASTKPLGTNVTITGTGSGNISLKGSFYNFGSQTNTLTVNLYRVTGSGDVWVGSGTLSASPLQLIAPGTINLASAQPAGTYKAVATSTYNWSVPNTLTFQ